MEQRKQNLLVVDDDPMSLDMLARRLERHGFAVGRAPGGREALEYLRRHPTDLILLDHHMPGMTGLDVLQSVRRTHPAGDLPIIMVTAASDSHSIVSALNLGANDYVTKPVDFDVALARIGSQLTRRAAERELRATDGRDAVAARASNDGLWDWNLETNEVYYSDRWKAMLGLENDEIESSPTEWFSRIHPDDSNRVQHDLEAAISGATQSFENLHRQLHKDQSWRWMLTRGRASFNESGKAARLAGSQTDVTESKTADPLTNLPNRTRFTERVAAAIERARHELDYSFAVFLLDVDRFQVINDSLGHLVGDELLVGVARRLRLIDEKFPATLARMGGDEFGILLDEVAGHADAVKVARWVAHVLARPFLLESREVYCSMSIGITTGPGDALKPEDILRDADTAMYRAKTLGGGRYEMFDQEMRRRAMERLELETDLRHALEHHEFEVYYQPKVDLKQGTVSGFEALIRWNHPRRGLLEPAEFIPMTEETGLIVPLGVWVLEQSCSQLKAWQTEFPRIPPFTMSVNVSAYQFREPGFSGHVRRVLQANALHPDTLRLELTESALLDDVLKTGDVMHELKGIGVGIKIDDFGTGYSSLSNLVRLPIDTLKIDRSFVNDLGQGRDGTEIVETVMRLASGLKLDVVAEGVETREQADLLRTMGCRYAQGFYFFRPQDAGTVAKLLQNQKTCDPMPEAC